MLFLDKIMNSKNLKAGTVSITWKRVVYYPLKYQKPQKVYPSNDS